MKKLLFALLLLAFTLFVYLRMRPTANHLITHDTPLGILNLEFAYDSMHTAKVMNAWNAGNKIESAKENTYIDFGFIFFYSLFLFYTCKSLSNNFRGNISRLGRVLSGTAIIAGMLDIVENAGMLITLGRNGSPVISMITAISASLKWFLVAMAIFYIILISPVVLYLYIRNKKQVFPK